MKGEMKIKIKMKLNGMEYELEGKSLKELKHQIIVQTVEQEKKISKNITDAVLNTAVLLEIDERTVWAHLKQERELAYVCRV